MIFSFAKPQKEGRDADEATAVWFYDTVDKHNTVGRGKNMVKALRIDHRLVHGQVAFTWTHHLGATRIIVIDDKAATDEMQKMAISLAKPAGVKLNLFTVERALEKAEKIDALNDIIYIIFGCTKDAARFICSHPGFSELNLGGIKKKENSRKYSEVIYLTPDEEEDLRQIERAGTKLFMQQLPTSNREYLSLI